MLTALLSVCHFLPSLAATCSSVPLATSRAMEVLFSLRLCRRKLAKPRAMPSSSRDASRSGFFFWWAGTAAFVFTVNDIIGVGVLSLTRSSPIIRLSPGLSLSAWWRLGWVSLGTVSALEYRRIAYEQGYE